MSTPDTGVRRGRPKSSEKHDAIVSVARVLFTREPFERVNLDTVATEAGVSKATIYSHFPNKEALFAAAIGASCGEVFGRVDLSTSNPGPIEDVLRELGVAFLAMIFDPEAERLHATILAEGPRHPELPRMFYDTVVNPMTRMFADYLKAQADAGRIRIDDPYTAAVQFLAMVQGEFRYRVELGLPRASTQQIESFVRSCVDTLLRGWQP